MDIVLEADCSSCAGLCCVLLPYRAEQGFGVDKPGGTPCAHLDTAPGAAAPCGIHHRLAESGWTGCVAYDCQGAGQRVTQETYAGRDWRAGEINLGEMAAVFSVMRVLHERLAELEPGTAAYAEVAALTHGSPDDLLAVGAEL